MLRITSALQASYRCKAKINWDLYITGLLPDGYHELDSIVVPIDLCDEITIKIDDGDEIIVDCVECPGSDNLAWKAADAFSKFTNYQLKIDISIEKHIPSGAGLGGGSSDAACVIKGLNEMTGSDLSIDELKAIAAKVGADVPCFMHDGWRRMRGKGEIVENIEGKAYPIVLVMPDKPVSTPLAYKLFDQYCQFSKPSSIRFENPQNDLSRLAIMIVPQIQEVLNLLKLTGAKPFCMTGSGSACFGVYKTKKQAEEACLEISKRFRAISLNAGS